jgi:hypothetical protein
MTAIMLTKLDDLVKRPLFLGGGCYEAILHPLDK